MTPWGFLQFGVWWSGQGGLKFESPFAKQFAFTRGIFMPRLAVLISNFDFNATQTLWKIPWFSHYNSLEFFLSRSYEIYNVNFVPLYSGFLFDSLASGFSPSLLQIRNVHPQGQFLRFLKHFPLHFFLSWLPQPLHWTLVAWVRSCVHVCAIFLPFFLSFAGFSTTLVKNGKEQGICGEAARMGKLPVRSLRW